jgi:hypothetical protein
MAINTSDPAFLSLVSGLIGAVIGGLFTLLASSRSVRVAAEKSFELEKERRGLDRKDSIKNMLCGLKTETYENLDSISSWETYRSKFRFSSDTWIIYKHLIPELQLALQETLIKAYTRISKHNTSIDYDLRIPFGLGAKDAEIERMVVNVKEALINLKTELEKTML